MEPIEPKTAVEWCLEDRSNELAAAPLKSHEYQLSHFIRWCEEENIKNLNTLTGRKRHQYRIWRRNDGNLNTVREKKQMDTLRIFVRWLEAVDGVEQDLSTKVISPSLSPNENTRDVMLDSERASEILTHLAKYEYAGIQHVSISLLWRTTMRTGSAYALDEGDYRPNDQCLEVRHRPEEGTPIKNKLNGERFVALSDPICNLLDDWISTKRPYVVDEYDREPLLATRKGRTAKSTLRTYVYRCPRPCVIDHECPHDWDPSECEVMTRHAASECPSSVSPHAIRRGSITNGLNDDVNVVSGRTNVSQPILEQHYDARTEREKRKTGGSISITYNM